jgi:hypothetical protein
MAKAVKTTMAGIQAEVAAALVATGTTPPVDFRDIESPLRIEVETLLAKVVAGTTKANKTKAKKVARNQDRAATVKAYLDENYPGNTRLARLILDDLVSYSPWEVEEDDA